MAILRSSLDSEFPIEFSSMMASIMGSMGEENAGENKESDRVPTSFAFEPAVGSLTYVAIASASNSGGP